MNAATKNDTSIFSKLKSKKKKLEGSVVKKKNTEIAQKVKKVEKVNFSIVSNH